MKVLLAIPPGKLFATLNPITTPLGILYCASFLERQGCKVDVIDALAESLSIKDILAKIRAGNYDLIGISVLTDNRFSAFELSDAIKSEYPKLPIVMGGPHVSLDPVETLKRLKSVDYIVRGEGELVLLNLVECIKRDGDVRTVRGIYFRNGKNGEVTFSGSQELIGNIDDLPFPARHLVDLDRYKMYTEVRGVGRLKTANIIISRGCPIGCSFCSNTLLWGRSIRRRSNENIIEEIMLLKNTYGIRCLTFSDDTLNYNKKKLMDLCETMIRLDLNVHWSCAMRADNIDEDLISLMKQAGCYRVNYGVESGSRRILDTVVEKKIDLDKVIFLSKLLNKYDIENWPSFIVSFPSETYEEALETLKFMKSLDAKPVLNICRIYPGTRVENEARKRNIIPRDFSWAEKDHMNQIKDAIPKLTGDIPFYIELLDWSQISTILFEWSKMVKFSLWQSAVNGLRSVRNFTDVKRLALMGFAYLKVRFFSEE